MNAGRDIVSLIAQRQNLEHFRLKYWTGTFEEYLDIVRERPSVMRNAFQRVYDMIMSCGVESYEVTRERRQHYYFFDDPADEGRDAILRPGSGPGGAGSRLQECSAGLWH